jgi:Fic family protein
MKNARDLFVQTDQQIGDLKKRIARQREVIKQAKLRGHSTAAAETIQRTLHQSFRAFEQRRQQVSERLEAKQRPTVKREAEEDWG